MVYIEKITSFQNEKYKLLAALHQKKWRDKTGLFIVEGKKEINFALQECFEVQSIWLVEEILEENLALLQQHSQLQVFSLTQEMFEKIGYREKTEGILAVVHKPNINIEELDKITLQPSQLIIIGLDIEKPGNIGALFRVADGAGVAALIFSQQQVDIFNPNIIRNSVGTFFHVPFVVSSKEEIVQWLCDHKFTIMAAAPDSSTVYWKANYNQRIALVMGSEHDGVPADWLSLAEEKVYIPMKGINDSLNVSVAASIISYEWHKQNTGR